MQPRHHPGPEQSLGHARGDMLRSMVMKDRLTGIDRVMEGLENPIQTHGGPKHPLQHHCSLLEPEGFRSSVQFR